MPKILIVDDEPHIRLLLEETLEDFEDAGVEILSARDGKEALDIILGEMPDVVYLDVMMPRMNGYDVCEQVKKKHGLKDVYIVMLTAKGQEFDKKKGMEVGADMYMTKPFDPDFVVANTEKILGIKI